MTTKKGNATEPVDHTAIPQDAGEKPAREALAQSGYVIPEHWEQLESGEPLATADFKPLATVNAEADRAQVESLRAFNGTAPGTDDTGAGVKPGQLHDESTTRGAASAAKPSGRRK